MPFISRTCLWWARATTRCSSGWISNESPREVDCCISLWWLPHCHLDMTEEIKLWMLINVRGSTQEASRDEPVGEWLVLIIWNQWACTENAKLIPTFLTARNSKQPYEPAFMGNWYSPHVALWVCVCWGGGEERDEMRRTSGTHREHEYLCRMSPLTWMIPASHHHLLPLCSLWAWRPGARNYANPFTAPLSVRRRGRSHRQAEDVSEVVTGRISVFVCVWKEDRGLEV